MSEQARLAAQTLADRALAQLADANERANGEITTLRDAVDGLRSTLSRTEDRASRAEARAADADMRADRAEQAIAVERARADELQAGQVLMVDMHAAELAAAHEAARTAEERAEALGRANDARRARGRLRRAWDGWRGR